MELIDIKDVDGNQIKCEGFQAQGLAVHAAIDHRRRHGWVWSVTHVETSGLVCLSKDLDTAVYVAEAMSEIEFTATRGEKRIEGDNDSWLALSKFYQGVLAPLRQEGRITWGSPTL